MKVRDVMGPPASVPRSASVAEVVRMMLDQALDGVAVVDDNGQTVGLITERDVVTRHAHPHVPVYIGVLGGVLPFETSTMDEEVRRVLAVTAADLMSDLPHSVDPDADLTAAADLMVDRRVNPVPVVEGGKLVGLVGHRDMLRLLRLEEEDGVANG